MSDIMYLSINSPTLTVKLAGRRVSAVNGVFKDLSQAEAEAMEHLLRTAPNIRTEVRRVDMEEAARKAKEFAASRPTAAIKGVVTSGTQAAAILRDAKQKQESQALTGLADAVNISTNEKKSEPLEVTEIPVEPPKTGSFANRFSK